MPALRELPLKEINMIAVQMRKLFAFNNWAWERVFASV